MTSSGQPTGTGSVNATGSGRHRQRPGVGCAMAIALFSSAWTSPADAQRFIELGRTSPSFEGPAYEGFAIADLDGIPGDEFVFTAWTTGLFSQLFVVGRDSGGSIVTKQSRVVDDVNNHIMLTPGAPVNGETLYLLGGSGVLTAFGGWPLQPLRTLSLPKPVNAAVIGDVNADGELDIVVSGANRVTAYSLASGNPLWGPWGVQNSHGKLALLQLDADPALEIVGSSTGAVYDGALGTNEGAPSGGFGQYVAGGRTGASGGVEIVATVWEGLRVFAPSAPWAVRWTAPYSGAGSVLVTDLDGDQRDEILVRTASSVQVLDSATHALRRAIATNGGQGGELGIGDLDGDGGSDLAMGTMAEPIGQFAAPRFRIVDAHTSALRFSVDSQPGPFAITALADLDDDGDLDQVAASFDDYGPSWLHLLDAERGALQWQSPGPSPMPPQGTFDMSYFVAVPMPASPLAGAALVVGGKAGSDGRILVIDGRSHAVRFQIGADGPGPLRSRSVKDIVIRDHNGDGIADIIAVTEPLTTAAQSRKIHVFSGSNGALLAESADIDPSAFLAAKNLLSGDVDGDGHDDLIVVSPNSLRSFDGQTLQPKWTLLATAAGARYMSEGAAGPELLVFAETGGITFYDARSRAFLRSLPSPSPLTAVRVLEGDQRRLLVAANERLQLLDGITGSVLASSERLGSSVGVHNQLAAVSVAPGVWQVALGGDAGYFRYRLELSESIFETGFDGSGASRP